MPKKNNHQVIEQPDKYRKQSYPFGNIAVAYVRKRDEYNITFWGRDGVFEQLKLRSGKSTEANEGTFDSSGVSFSPVQRTPPNIAARQKEISDIINSLN